MELLNVNSDVAAGVPACRRGRASRHPEKALESFSRSELFQCEGSSCDDSPGGTPLLYGRRGRPPLQRVKVARRVPAFSKNLGFAVLFLMAFFSLNLSAQAQSASPEYKLKAVFLFNFVQYVDWPTNAFANEESPLVIGILGTDPFGKFLDETVLDEVVKNRKLQVRRYRNVSEIKECHILYISTSEAANLKTIMAALKGRSILTVSDIQNFTKIHGGIIRFLTDQNKIRFSINVTVAKEEDLTISSKLLQLADVVR